MSDVYKPQHESRDSNGFVEQQALLDIFYDSLGKEEFQSCDIASIILSKLTPEQKGYIRDATVEDLATLFRKSVKQIPRFTDPNEYTRVFRAHAEALQEAIRNNNSEQTKLS